MRIESHIGIKNSCLNNTKFEINVSDIIDREKTTDNLLETNQYICAGLNNGISIIESAYWDAMDGVFKKGEILSEDSIKPEYNTVIFLKNKLQTNDYIVLKLADINKLKKNTLFFHLSEKLRSICLSYKNGEISKEDTMCANMLYWGVSGETVFLNKRYKKQDLGLYSCIMKGNPLQMEFGKLNGKIQCLLNGVLAYETKVKDFSEIALSVYSNTQYNIDVIEDIYLAKKEAVVYLKPIDLGNDCINEVMSLFLLCKGNPQLQLLCNREWINISDKHSIRDSQIVGRLLLSGDDRVYKIAVSKP